VFSEGGSAAIDPATPGGDGYVVVPDVDRTGVTTRVGRLTRIPDDWLVDRAEVRATLRWAGTRVEVLEQMRFGELVLDEGPGTGDPDAVATLLAGEVAAVAHKVFPDFDAAEALSQRIAWLRRVGVDLPEVTLTEIVRAACVGRRSFADLGGVSLVGVIGRSVDLALVDRLAPVAIPLGNRKRTPITYPVDQDPFIASRMQDFFGLDRSPLLAGDRPLVLHLLAPNQRPVQITGDLAGFWKNHWPGIRRELMRRYPRQAWPENPLEAEPPEFRERRR
jgi:ATP-dependent helicase HrpB